MTDFTDVGKWPPELRRALEQIPSLDEATKEREAIEETRRKPRNAPSSSPEFDDSEVS